MDTVLQGASKSVAHMVSLAVLGQFNTVVELVEQKPVSDTVMSAILSQRICSRLLHSRKGEQAGVLAQITKWEETKKTSLDEYDLGTALNTCMGEPVEFLPSPSRLLLACVTILAFLQDGGVPVERVLDNIAQAGGQGV